MLNDRCDDPVPIRRVQFMAAAVDVHHDYAGDNLGQRTTEVLSRALVEGMRQTADDAHLLEHEADPPPRTICPVHVRQTRQRCSTMAGFIPGKREVSSPNGVELNDGQGAHTCRMLQRRQLCDDAAERHPDEVCGRELVAFKHRDGVVGQIIERVKRRAGLLCGRMARVLRLS